MAGTEGAATLWLETAMESAKNPLGGRPKTTVIVPCFNEERRLDAGAFLSALGSRPWLSLLFVDDGSLDGTAALLAELEASNPEQISSLRLTVNQGKAEAVRRGVIQASSSEASVLGYWDADLATPLSELDAMLEVMERRGAFIILGSRQPRGGTALKRRLTRRALALVFNLCARAALSIRLQDTQCGAKLFRNDGVAEALFERPFTTRWIFDVELLARLRRYDRLNRTEHFAGLVEHPLSQWTEVSGSAIKAADYFIAAGDLLTLIVEERLGARSEARR